MSEPGCAQRSHLRRGLSRCLHHHGGTLRHKWQKPLTERSSQSLYTAYEEAFLEKSLIFQIALLFSESDGSESSFASLPLVSCHAAFQPSFVFWVPQIVNEDIAKKTCEEHQLCVVAVLPHILDTGTRGGSAACVVPRCLVWSAFQVGVTDPLIFNL